LTPARDDKTSSPGFKQNPGLKQDLGQKQDLECVRVSQAQPRAHARTRTQKTAPSPALLDTAQHVLTYLNEVHGRHLSNTDQIATLLRRGVTVAQCELMIDWAYAIERCENPEGHEKYFNSVSPFRPLNFDRFLDRATRWDAAGRPTYDEQRLQQLSQRSMLDDPAIAREVVEMAQTSQQPRRSVFGLLDPPHGGMPHARPGV
jgi:hypothetical protein